MARLSATAGCYASRAAKACEDDAIREALRLLVEECHAAGHTHLSLADLRQLPVNASSVYRLECLLRKEEHSEIGLQGKPPGLPSDGIDQMDSEDVERELKRLRQPIGRSTRANRTRLRLARIGQ